MADDNVVRLLPGTGKRDPVAVLECAKAHGLTEVLIVGWDNDGDLCVFGSHDSFRDIAWLTTQLQAWLHRQIS